MVRYFSFIVLIAVIVLLIVLFYKVMVGFFVPLFLALIATILFQPLHLWMLELCRGREQWAAMFTTVTIMALVLVPLVLLLSLAVAETRVVVQRFSPSAISTQFSQMRTSLGLEIPAANEFFELENSFIALTNSYAVDTDEKRRRQLNLIQQEIRTFAGATGRSTVAEVTAEEPPDAWHRFLIELGEMRRLLLTERDRQNGLQGTNSDSGVTSAATVVPPPSETTPTEPANTPQADAASSGAAINPTDTATENTAGQPSTTPATGDLTSAKQQSASDPDGSGEDDLEIRQLKQVRATIRAWDSFKHVHCGGRTWSWLKLLANPTADQSQEYTERVVTWAREQGLSLTGATTAFIANTLLGIAIMVVAIYFFLLDGPQMIAAVRKLSPMDKDHERELLLEFSRVSRAVVLATLLAAIVQGLLAGAGFIIFGVENVFLLTVLTIALAMIPFVGAAAVWAPIAVSLYLFDGRPMAAVGLALYGTLIVSMADNVVKPMVLHGQSNLHPLFALLSVLGGVTALGPIGILIGPMITAFLQTLLEILQRELTRLPSPVDAVTAGASVNTHTANSDGSSTRALGPTPPVATTAATLTDTGLDAAAMTNKTPSQTTSKESTPSQTKPKKGRSKR